MQKSFSSIYSHNILSNIVVFTIKLSSVQCMCDNYNICTNICVNLLL